MIDEFKKTMNDVIEVCKEEVKAMRASHANPALVENIMVNAYDTLTPLQQLASITCPDTRSLVIQPWDKSVIKAIEKAIQDADLGINPVNEGEIIRMNMPQLTEERRKDLVKKLKEKIEDYRIRVRQERDKTKDAIQDAEKNGDINEDDKYKMLENLDASTTEYNKELKEISEKKEAEIMKV